MPTHNSRLSIDQKTNCLNLIESINLAKETKNILTIENMERRSFWNIVTTSSTPIIADCTSLCEKVDIIKEKQLYAIRLSGGLLSIDTKYNDYQITNSLIISLANKVEYLVDSFSSDNVVIGLSNLKVLSKVVDELFRRNYTDATINNIVYSNYLRVLKSPLN